MFKSNVHFDRFSKNVFGNRKIKLDISRQNLNEKYSPSLYAILSSTWFLSQIRISYSLSFVLGYLISTVETNLKNKDKVMNKLR